MTFEEWYPYKKRLEKHGEYTAYDTMIHHREYEAAKAAWHASRNDIIPTYDGQLRILRNKVAILRDYLSAADSWNEALDEQWLEQAAEMYIGG